MSTPAVMVLGTSSHVGKSLVTAALCRNFARAGIRVAPFKAQNMSLNSAATIEGLEIGRAQALQAEAAGIPASVHMNPVLLKPIGNAASQVVVCGKIWGKLSASDYHRHRVMELFPLVRQSYAVLAAQHELIVLEGAGSPAEINLKDTDIVNIRMAATADASCLLVGDIDRGGVFASLLGTMELLDAEERARIRGFAINKFRGDVDLLMPGVRAIEERLNRPCLGVIPYLPDFKLDEEDGLGLSRDPGERWRVDASPSRDLRIAVVCLPSLANFTDFDPLAAEPSVSLRFCRTAEELNLADVVIIPGSKRTVDDLAWMRLAGFDRALTTHASSGLTVGICGGMQMLGKAIHDPEGVETQGSHSGLGLLAIETIMAAEKTTVEAQGAVAGNRIFGVSVPPTAVRGYEIHVGRTIYMPGAVRFCEISRQGGPDGLLDDGCVSEDRRMFGTYLHGLFQEDGFRHEFLKAARASRGLRPASQFLGWKEARNRELDRLAAAVAESVDLAAILEWTGLAPQCIRRAARWRTADAAR